jgi:hypothetical protein
MRTCSWPVFYCLLAACAGGDLVVTKDLVDPTDAAVVDATDAPLTDAPATDAPATDAPATDAAGTDATASDVAGTDASRTDTGEWATDADSGAAPADDPSVAPTDTAAASDGLPGAGEAPTDAGGPTNPADPTDVSAATDAEDPALSTDAAVSDTGESGFTVATDAPASDDPAAEDTGAAPCPEGCEPDLSDTGGDDPDPVDPACVEAEAPGCYVIDLDSDCWVPRPDAGDDEACGEADPCAPNGACHVWIPGEGDTDAPDTPDTSDSAPTEDPGGADDSASDAPTSDTGAPGSALCPERVGYGCEIRDSLPPACWVPLPIITDEATCDFLGFACEDGGPCSQWLGPAPDPAPEDSALVGETGGAPLDSGVGWWITDLGDDEGVCVEEDIPGCQWMRSSAPYCWVPAPFPVDDPAYCEALGSACDHGGACYRWVP